MLSQYIAPKATRQKPRPCSSSPHTPLVSIDSPTQPHAGGRAQDANDAASPLYCLHDDSGNLSDQWQRGDRDRQTIYPEGHGTQRTKLAPHGTIPPGTARVKSRAPSEVQQDNDTPHWLVKQHESNCGQRGEIAAPKHHRQANLLAANSSNRGRAGATAGFMERLSRTLHRTP